MVDRGLFDGLKKMFMDRMDRLKKDPTVIDKVLIKTGRKEPEVIPEGLWFSS